MNNPLMCDPVSGVCEIPSSPNKSESVASISKEKSIKIIYFTDPICSSCWGIEPALRKLKLEYGAEVEIDYRMGGLLPDWSYNSGGISKPSDVAHHWDEVSKYYKMPIDGGVWLTDPLNSSYPPSIAFKAIQLQSQEKAIHFLRILREMVFIYNKNIAKPEILKEAAQMCGADVTRFETDLAGNAKSLFENDLELGRKMAVRGFPTFFITNQKGATETIYGFQSYDRFSAAIQKLEPTLQAAAYSKDLASLFQIYPSLCTQEAATLLGVSFEQAEQQLQSLEAAQKIKRSHIKNGDLWIKL